MTGQRGGGGRFFCEGHFTLLHRLIISNSYTTLPTPVRGDNPRALAQKRILHNMNYSVLKFAISIKDGLTRSYSDCVNLV